MKPNYMVTYSEHFQDEVIIGSVKRSVDIYVFSTDIENAKKQADILLKEKIQNHSDYVCTSANPIEFYTFKPIDERIH